MAKLVILKSFFDAYYDNMVEKSTTHKYIRKVPKSSGKGYNYFYPKDFAKPFKALLSFFGMKEDKVDKAYTDNNIQQAYGVSKQGFAQHVLEYLTNRKTWNTFFANKANRDKYKIPEKPVKKTETIEVKEKVIEGGKTKEKVTEKVTETKEKNFKSTWNRSLMRKIYSMYNSVPEDKIESKPGSDSIAIGDSVSYNGKVGTVQSKFKGGVFGVSFGNGSFGRFVAKDLQKMNPTSEEVTESTEINAEKQDVNGTNEAIKEEIKETVTVKDNPYHSVGAEIVKDFSAKIENTRNDYDEKKANALIRDVFIPDMIKIAAKTAVKTSDTKENAVTKTGQLVDAIKQNMSENDRNLFMDKYNFERMVDTLWNPEGKPTKETIQEEIKETEEEEKRKQAIKESEKNGIKLSFKINHEEQSLDELKKIKIDIQDVIKMSTDDEYSQPEDIDRLKAQLEAVEEMITERNTSALSYAMMGNQNARKYGNLSDEANEIIERQNLNVNDDGVVQPDEEDRKRSADFWKKNENKNYKFQKDQYGNTYMIMDGLDEYFFDKDGNRVTGAAFVHQRTYHDEYIPEEPNITIKHPGMYNDTIYLTPEMKEKMKTGVTDYQPVNSDYVKPEKETIIEDYIDLQNDKTKGKLKGLKYQMGKIYEMAKKTGIQVLDYTGGLMSNHGPVTNVILPMGETDQNKGFLIDKTNKALIDYAKYVAENVEPEEKIEIKNPDLPQPIKTFLSIAYKALVKMNPVMGKLYYIEQLKEKYPMLVDKVTDWSEIIENDNIELTEDDVKRFKEMAKTGEDVVSETTESEQEEHDNRSEAMLGNDNAKKDFTEEQQQEYNKTKQWYDDYSSDSSENAEEKGEVLKEELDKISEPEKDDRTKAKFEAVKDLYEETTGKKYERTSAVKPQTEKAMKKEEKKLEKARIDAGLPKPEMFVRTSTIDDSTWDPNSKNYRFRDTGYIAGARKEQAALFITRSAKEGVRVNAKEIDWTGIEENPRTAEKLIVKSNIFGDVDWNGLKDKGMSGSAAFLIDRIYASAGAKPSENNADARHNYVIALNGLRDRFEDCKTVDDVLETLNEIQDEIKGEYVEIKESPKYKELKDKMKAKRDVAWAKKDELYSLSENGRKTYDVEYQKVVEKYIEKGKKEKKIHWNARVSRYNIPKEYEDAFAKETKDLYKKAYAPWEKAVADFKEELKGNGVKDEEFFEESRYNPSAPKHEIGWYDLWKLMPEMKEYHKLSKELDDYVEGAKIVVAKKNPLLEAWKSLGSKFLDIKSSNTFAQHRYDARKGKYDDWDWLEKDVKVREKKPSKQKKLFNLLVAETIERKGGRNVDISSTADLKKAFNLRDVQSGNWVLKDPESAEFHVRNAARALADLADITGIPDDKISLNGRLAMAFGARGTGNAGGSTAMAHYESVERVINLTKFKGGGCLGHEWFHAFDNLITCAMNGDNTSDIYLTNRYSNLTPATKALVLEYLKYKDASDYMGTYRRGQIARKLKAKNFDVADLNKPQTGLQLKVQNAFDELVKAMTEGDSTIKSAVVYSKKDYDNMLFNFKEEKLKQWRDYDKIYSRSKPTMQVAIADAGSLDKAVKMINERYGSISDPKTLRQKSEWVRLAAAYYDRQPDGNEKGLPLLVDSGKRGSQYLADAFDLDENGAKSKDYWSSTHEMAARAFSAYIEDTLKEQGRLNDYLSYAANNSFYDDGRPYPEGEERKRINAAFKKLFEVVRENNAIEKAVAIVDAPDFIIKNGRFLIRK